MCNIDEDQVMKFQNMNENDHHLYMFDLCVKPTYLSSYFLTKQVYKPISFPFTNFIPCVQLFSN